ncbi:hypothetical protein FRC11_001717 [Ceratobasidium sp. 423]|nr:hypothetical protein FRC11_001717 [Ceratobasidium sp. 423]
MQLCELNKKYGPIASLKMGSNNMIVIAGDGSIIRELFDKRGAIYSNRPLEISTEIAGRGDHALWERDANRWRVARKQMVQHYPRASKNRYAELQEAESVQLLYDFLHSPEHHMHHPMRYATSVVTCLNYGVRCAMYDDPVVREVEDILNRLTVVNVPGTKPPVEQFPWMWYLPGFITGHWKDKVEDIGKIMDKLYCGLADIGWERGINGLNPDNLAYKLRLNEGTTRMTRHRQAHVCGLLLEGGSDIVAAVISTCIMALVENTTHQKRAQEEIDGLYNEETLPKWEDEQKMPFVRAVVREALRWRTPLPMGVPHENEQGESTHDYYGGYFFPKGSTGKSFFAIMLPAEFLHFHLVVCNTAAIHLDPARYDDPTRFKPERFLDCTLSMAESAVQSDPLKRDHFSFGAGRRSCPGVQVAEQDIFIALARLLWAFEFSTPTGVSVVTDQLHGFFGEGIRRPREFPLVIKARSERRKATIGRELALVKESIFSLYGSYE